MTSILDQLTQEEFQDMMGNVNASQLRVLLEAERKKNAALAAQVEHLRDALKGIAALNPNKWKLPVAITRANQALKLTPTQCLAERDAEVAKDAYFAGMMAEINNPSTTHNRLERVEQYANQLRQAARGW